jgi:hypothetical protein
LVASALTIASGAIHLHLYTAGYRAIPTIGSLFIVQGVAAIVVSLVASALRRVWTALLGAGLMVGTVAGFLISVNDGLFGFQDTFRGTNQISAFVVELAASALFLVAAAVAVAGGFRPASPVTPLGVDPGGRSE